ncbi:sensor histidine kinase [Rhodoferax sp.]|uniref:sensor histidine kinase n=1 Tax=Rhodoferax sp. TaxID=50421 RepID=UPI0027528BDA|nr:HAMP domain-containing sensor histidine kinase [Rhodoferax sp.]
MSYPSNPAPGPSIQGGPTTNRRFRLVRYFSLTALGLFAVVALALTYFEAEQGRFFQAVQQKHNAFFKQVQEGFAKQQDAAARRDLLAIHEAGNVNLTRLFANTLWERDFAPFVARAQAISADHCRAIADVADPKDGKLKPPAEKKACFADVGKQIMALKDFALLNAKVFDSMKKTTVFKIKVFDLRGITVYSSEHAQIGEDKSFNAGWKSAAMDSKPSSEMTFRGKFSAFEGVVENRDLISSYMPVLAPGGDQTVAVFEVYSDVTPFLDQIKATSAQIRLAAKDDQARVEAAAAQDQLQVDSSALTTLLIVLGLLMVLFTALYLIVRRADRILVEQEHEREHAQQHLAQAEKMASLGQMVAGVAHQLNTPLAFSHSNVSMAIEVLKSFSTPLKVAAKLTQLIKSTDAERVNLNVAQVRAQIVQIDEDSLDVAMPVEMLSETLLGIDQMRELVENLRDFTRLDRSKTAAFNLNKGLHNVVYIARSVIPTHVAIHEEFGALPMLECNASQLNQVFLNLINNAAQAITTEGGQVTVTSRVEGDRIRVDVTDTGTGIAPDVLPHIFENYFTTKVASEGTGLGLPIARSIVQEHGGEIRVETELGKGSTFSVLLPLLPPASAQGAATPGRATHGAAMLGAPTPSVLA